MELIGIEVKEKQKINKIKTRYQQEINFQFQVKKENNKFIFPLDSNISKEKLEEIKKDEEIILLKLIKFSKKTDHLKKEKIGKILIIKETCLELSNFDFLSNLLKHENVETILSRDPKGSSGEFKLTKYNFIFGKNTRETIYEENNLKFKIDIENVFYSSKLYSDRKRISKLIKKEEKILICFCGYGEFICCLYKNPKKIIGIDLNKKAIEYAKFNLKLNKMEENCILLNEDIFQKKFDEEIFDRIVIPQLLYKDLDMTKLFIDHLSLNMKLNTKIHIYDHLNKNEIEIKKEKIIEWFDEKKFRIEIEYYLAGNIGNDFYRICFDIEIISPFNSY